VSGLAVYVAIRAMSAVFAVLPEALMRRAGMMIGWTLGVVSRRKAALLRSHLIRVLGPVPDVDRRVRRMFSSYGRYWAEVFWVRPRRRAEIISEARVVGLEHIRAAQDAGNGIILALPHLGNWETAGAKAEEIGIPVLAVAELLANERVVKWFLDVRTELGIDVVLTDQGRRMTESLMRRLKEGGTIALLADRDLTGRGLEVEFFGERTTVPAGPVSLADRTGAALLPVGCYFNRGRGHTFVVHPPIDLPEGETRKERLAHGAQALAHVLEDIIRVEPEQWHLFQPNWPSDTAVVAAK
jgi:lauroyl/myristoyl acyltransferase